MAKDKKKHREQGEDPVATALTEPDTPIDAPTTTSNGVRVETPAAVAASTPPALPAATEPGGAGRPAPVGSPTALAESVVSVASGAADVVRRVLPHRTPVYLGGLALLVLGVAELPAVAAGALAYEAVRRWTPDTTH